MTPDSGTDLLGRVTGVLAVVAHPDDESFGPGPQCSQSWSPTMLRPDLICFIHGESSPMHGRPGDLSVVRAQELQAASADLRLSRVELHHYPDGQLEAVPLDELAGQILRMIGQEHRTPATCSTLRDKLNPDQLTDPAGQVGQSRPRRG